MMAGGMSQAEQVRRLLAQYCAWLDDRRYDDWSHLFTDDGVWDLAGRERTDGSGWQFAERRLAML
jgi:hypothetical protein